MKPKKYLGQYFLKNKKILSFLANSLGNIHKKIVVEIGGGHGELTKFLINAKRLIVYEIDKELCKVLKNRFLKIEIINEDFLSADLSKFKNNFCLIGNIPYYITGKILRKIFDIKEHPEIAILTFQKEYGEKILGFTGNNFLNNWAKVWCDIKKLILIKKENFMPQPKVDSISLKFIFYKKPLIENFLNFEEFLKSIFKFPNKTIENNIKNRYSINNIDKDIIKKRAHQLSFEEIKNLFSIIDRNNN